MKKELNKNLAFFEDETKGVKVDPRIVVSIPIIAITDCGFVLASAGIFGGSWKYIWGGISILIVMILIGRTLTKTKDNAV